MHNNRMQRSRRSESRMIESMPLGGPLTWDVRRLHLGTQASLNQDYYG
jgi:hypothetical protein